MITVTIDVCELARIEDDETKWPYRKSHLEEVGNEMSFSLGKPDDPERIEITAGEHTFYVEKSEFQKIAILLGPE